MYKLGFIGFGNMASAIAKGVLKNGFIQSTEIIAYDPDFQCFEKFDYNIMSSNSALHVIEQAKYIFLCVKPQIVSEAIVSFKKALTDNHILISIAAGITTDYIESMTDNVCPVIRTMPNTPLLIGYGVTAISKPERIGDCDYNFVNDIFNCVGSVYEIPKDKFNEIIPVNASSPAFIYLFSKAIADSAQKHGLDYDIALNMFSDTLIGSAKMIKESGHDVTKLIDMVSSKGGTTVAALSAMRDNGFIESITKGFDSCIARAYELGAK